MKYFFIGRHAYSVKLVPFHVFLLIISSLIITIQSINGAYFYLFNNKLIAAGNSYYVDTDSVGGVCNNDNPGSITQPWCTIQKATSSNSPVEAGDTIYVRSGTYTGTIDFYKSGTSNSPITLTAYQDETVNILGELRIDPNAIEGYLAENWTFSKLNISNPSRDGIHIANGNHSGTITIDDCNISNNHANGIMAGWANNNVGTLIVKNSTIQYNDDGDDDGNSGLYLFANGTYIIQNNNISYNGDPNRTSSGNKGISFYQGVNKCANCLIENNVFEDNLETGMDFNGNNGVIRNNLFIGNGRRDTEADEYGDDGLAIQSTSSYNKIYNNIIASSGGYELSVFGNNNEFYNNTFYKDYNYTATQVPASHYYSTVMLWSGTGHTFRNNIIVNMLNISGRQYALMTKEFDVNLYTGSTWSNNLYYSSYSDSNYVKINSYTNLAALQGTGQDANSVFDVPDFDNGSGHDFHYQDGSPAIDSGYNLSGIVTTDLEGITRPQNSVYDMGVYEEVSETPASPADPVLQSSTHPNENSWYSSASVDLNLASGTGADHYHYLVNQNPTTTLSALAEGNYDADGSFTVNLTGDGTWYIHIVAHDASNNPSNNYDTYTIHYDATAPTSASLSFSNITSSSITAGVSGAVDATAGLHTTEPYYFENLTIGANSGWQTGTSWVSGNLSSSTNYQFKVKVKDQAGNILEVTSAETTSSGSTNSNTNSNTNTNPPGGGGSGTNSNTNINTNANSNPEPGPEPTSQEGWLAKLSTSPVVYYLSETNHNRYTFPDENVFYSWYYNFNDVEIISYDELQTYPLAGNVTIRPGTRLVKIISDPKVYAVEPGGVLHWIVNEDIFYGLGYSFDMVIDLPDILFQDYYLGEDINCLCEHPVGVLIKYPGNQAVYYYDGMQKRAFANEGAFWWNRFYWEYVIEAPEYLQYATGDIISTRETDLVLSW